MSFSSASSSSLPIAIMNRLASSIGIWLLCAGLARRVSSISVGPRRFLSSFFGGSPLSPSVKMPPITMAVTMTTPSTCIIILLSF